MIVDKLHIKNYRCFGDTPTVIEFSKSGLTALIGPNNIGKSTVLKVLDLLLGDKWPSGRFSEDDFHNNDLDKDIVLACTFRKPIEIKIKDKNNSIKGVVIRAKHLSSGYGESSIDVEYRLLKSENGLETLEFEKLDIATYGDSGGSPIYINQEIKNQLPVVIIVPLVKLQSEQPTNKWSVLGRMLQKVERRLYQNDTEKKIFKNAINNAIEILKNEVFRSIEEDIKIFWEEMKPKNLTGTELKFLGYEPWRYYREFKLTIQQNGIDVPIETLGEGVQRLAVIAIYRTYLKRHGRNERAILLIEEPESYLHPQARKNLFHILKEAIKKEDNVEGQIIYTTHSESFIDCGDFDNIVIFLRNTSNIEVRQISEEKLRKHTIALGQPEDQISDQHIHYKLIETISQGLKEALFTHKAIIVEGLTEFELFRLFTDAEKEQIGIVSAGGKSNIPAIYSFLTAFGIPCLVVIDRDSENKTRTIDENSKIVKMLTQQNALEPDDTKIDISLDEVNGVKDGEIFIKERILVFGRNLETVLGSKIPDWSNILRLLRETFHLPTGSQKVGPRDINALALIYFDIVANKKQNIVFSGYENLLKKIGEVSEDIKSLIDTLNRFILQDLKIPQLLRPAS